MKAYAEVYILDALYSHDFPYIYFVLPEHRKNISVGSFVLVPFGRSNRKTPAVVAALKEQCDIKNIKTVYSPIESPARLDEAGMKLCAFIKNRTFCTFGAAVRAVLPKGLSFKAENYWVCNPDGRSLIGEDEATAFEIFDFIDSREGSGAYEREIVASFGDEAFPALKYSAFVNALAKQVKIVEHNNVKTVKIVTLGDSEKIKEFFNKHQSATLKKRAELLEVLSLTEGITQTELSLTYGISPQVVKSAAKSGLVKIEDKKVNRLNGFLSGTDLSAVKDPFENPLTEQQKAAVKTLFALLDEDKPTAALLRGVTGSGKTRVILECVKKTLDCGKTAIVLIPEIGLTAQALSVYRKAFGDKIAVIHSMLSEGERADTYTACKNGDIKLVIGTRSAIFAPLANLGLVAIDEEQEHTYKSEMSPKYHARDIARFLCAQNNALMLCASATPSIESYYKATQGIYTLVELDKRATPAPLPQVILADCRDDDRVGNRFLIGEKLKKALEAVKENNEQSVLFVNRRGYNSFISCRDCGTPVTCPNCSVSMTHHVYNSDFKKSEKLICHYCGYTRAVPDTCEACGGKHIGYFGFGSEKLQDELERDFPNLKGLRMDADTTSGKFSHFDILNEFASGKGDVLYGTQMVAKGLDFPNVRLVGAINADNLLYMDDFRAGERTFSLITQLIGRAGRSDKRGVAIIQTYNPDNEILKKAATQDYVAFAKGEIAFRKAVLFPPFCDIALLELACEDELLLNRFSEYVKTLSEQAEKTACPDAKMLRYGPYKRSVYKANGKYRRQIVYKYKDNKYSRAFLSELLISAQRASKSSGGVTVELDINPSVI